MNIPTLSLEQWARQEGRVCWADVKQGLLQEPKEPSLEEIAQGHPDNESVQAARRVLEKRRARGRFCKRPTTFFAKEDV